MKILITGNMGYVGPGVVAQLRRTYPDAELIGYDMAYFASCLTNAAFLPERNLNTQYFGDVRQLPERLLAGVDVVIHLAAISNDPMGNRYEQITLDINYGASVRIAELAKAAGAKAFVFASSCSMYGASEGTAKTETSKLNPLTAYARSKVASEQGLAPLADDTFTITALRFATACGMSDRLRLDLVLNDFVACAISTGEINILSDGSPWRPLIHVKDMARAIEWAVDRQQLADDAFLAINAGGDHWNFQVHELAAAVNEAIPGTSVLTNMDAPPDKRSYKVSFELFKEMAPHHQPRYTLNQTILELYAGLLEMGFDDNDFHNSPFMRLKVLNRLQENGHLDAELEWIRKNQEHLVEQA